LPVAHLSIQLELGQRAATEDSFNFNITLLILNNVVINLFMSFKGVRVELFPPPPKSSGCDFKQ
jgi:hydrogenase-4 membrane subunit HyfE